MSNSLANRAISGFSWSVLAVLVNAGSQIVIGAIMARLLTPADFGIVAISMIVLRFGQYFSQLGMAAAVIQKMELSKEDLVTAHNMAILSGLIIALIVYFSTPLLGITFKNLEIIPVVQVMALTFIISGFGVVSGAMLRRSMRFRYIALTDVVSYLFAYTLGIYLAYQGYGVWALVTAMLVQQLIRTLMNYFAAIHPIFPVIYLKSLKPLFSYGGRSSIVGFLEFLYGSLDSFFIGRYLGADQLGLYSRVKMVVDLPLYYTGSSVNKVLFPLFSNMNSDLDNTRLRQAFLDVLLLLSVVLLPIALLVSASAELVILVMLGHQWMSALSVAQLIPFASFFGLLASIFGVVFDARDLLNRKILVMSLLLLMLVIGFYLLQSLNSLFVYSMLLVFGSFALLCANAFILGRDILIGFKQYFYVVLESIKVALPVGVVSYSLSSLFFYYAINPFLALPLVWMLSGFFAMTWVVFGPFKLLRAVIYDRLLKSILNKTPLGVRLFLISRFDGSVI